MRPSADLERYLVASARRTGRLDARTLAKLLAAGSLER
jgi:hypothetical protein